MAEFLETVASPATRQRAGTTVNMLGDSKIDSLDTHLEQFKLNSQINQNELQIILKEYSQLLENYKTLRQSYDGRGSKNGHLESPEKPRSTYVLVLVDGNGYIFNDELVKDKEEGGMKAARMLNECVEKYLRDNLLHTRTSRVIVRIYADLTNLSKQLAKSKLVGLEKVSFTQCKCHAALKPRQRGFKFPQGSNADLCLKRSLAPFAAGFTRAMNLFDFIDALDEEGTKYKIRETFKSAAEDSACSHIFYAACHDTSYLAPLLPLSGVRNKVTLVQGAGFNPEFHQFGLNVTPFPTVFRWSELPSAVSNSNPSTSKVLHQASPFKIAKATREQTPTQTKLRNDFPWENHAVDTAFGADEPSLTGANHFQETNGAIWISKPDSSPAGKVPCKYFQKGYCRFGNKCNFQHISNGLGLAPHPTNGIAIDRTNIASSLPTSIAPGYIPLNKDSQRIDTYIKVPTQEEWMIYNGRFRRQKPCNSYHLQHICTAFSCPFDHNDLEPEARHSLKYVLKCSPCPRKSACRVSDCYYGHLCQKDECTGQMKGCRMKTDMHNVDPKLASLVPSEAEMAREDYQRTPSDPDSAPLW